MEYTSFRSVICGLIVEIDGLNDRRRKHEEYGAILLGEMGGRLREEMMYQI